MSSNTPYTPPRATVADVDQEYGELKILSAKGRIGRVRFLGWSMGFSILARIVLIALIGAGIASGSQGLTKALIFIGGIGVYAVISLFAIQRLHDLDKSGWLCLLLLVPLVNIVFAFYLIFAPGSKETNQYGNPPPPNTLGVIVLAWFMPMIAIIGILAAIAIPAYQGYVQKAKQAQMQTQPVQQP